MCVYACVCALLSLEIKTKIIIIKKLFFFFAKISHFNQVHKCIYSLR